VHSLSGPDELGRIAFIENDMLNGRHSLKVIQVDGGNEKTVFQAEGDALWSNAVGRHLALERRTGQVALVAAVRPALLKTADAYLMEGKLQVWGLENRERLPVEASALDGPICWFPDGKRVAYTALIAPSEAESLLRSHLDVNESFAGKTLGWTKVPCVHVLDVETGKSRALHVGERPVVSPDGRFILLSDFELQWRILDIESNRSRGCHSPGVVYPGAIAVVDANTVLYWALPTDGIASPSTQHSSSDSGKKKLRALKLLNLRNENFQTVVPVVDPKHAVSFGIRAQTTK